MAQPRSVERAAWAMLRAAEIDVIRLIEALIADLDGSAQPDGAELTIDGRRFAVRYLDGDLDPRDARLIVQDAAQIGGRPSMN